jgi:hypothetical protein
LKNSEKEYTMAILLMVLDNTTLVRIEEEAARQGERFDVLLSDQFQEFLAERRYIKAPVKAAAAQPVQSQESSEKAAQEEQVLASIGRAAQRLGREQFVFADVVASMPDMEELTSQEQRQYASLFARRCEEVGVVKAGKNSSKVTLYALAQ